MAGSDEELDQGSLGYDYHFALARYNSNGSLDPSFSGDGTQTTDFGGNDQAYGVALENDGRIVAAGQGGNSHFALARYGPDGSLDPTFSGDGKVTTGFGFGPDDAANGIAVLGDGKIVAAGRTSGGATSSDFALARYNPTGTLDTSFSGNGKQTTGFGGYDAANAVALDADGKIVAVGEGRGSDWNQRLRAGPLPRGLSHARSGRASQAATSGRDSAIHGRRGWPLTGGPRTGAPAFSHSLLLSRESRSGPVRVNTPAGLGKPDGLQGRSVSLDQGSSARGRAVGVPSRPRWPWGPSPAKDSAGP